MDTSSDVVERFVQAARWASEVVGRLADADWSGPGLGDWDLRALVGHTSRSLITTDTYLDRPAESEVVTSAADYYLAVDSLGPSDAVTERGRKAGETLGDDPPSAFSDLVERVIPRVEGAGDPLIETIAGGMRLHVYLESRIFELVVHGLDICAAAGVDSVPPEAPLRSAMHLAVDLSVLWGTAPELILALTGRGQLREGFTVLSG